MKLALTLNAIRRLYGNNRLCLVGADVLSLVQPLMPEPMRILVLREDGSILTRQDMSQSKDDAASGLVSPTGMAIGLMGVLVGKATARAGAAWAAFVESQGMFAPLEVQELSGFEAKRRQDAMRFLLQQATKSSEKLSQQLAEREAGLAFLREKNEHLMLELEKARRMIQGAGYGLQSIVLDLPVGDVLVGPGAAIDTHHFRQLLPIDTAGLWAVDLQIVMPEGAEVPGDGSIEVIVSRASDGAILAQESRSFASVPAGWCRFRLQDAATTAFGDAVLDVHWHGDARPAPLMCLAPVTADRFGDEGGRSLALRLMKGLADPTVASTPDRGAIGGTSWLRVSPASLLGRAEWAFGEDSASLLSGKADRGWIQTHARLDGLSGVVYRSAPAGTTRVSVNVVTAHKDAPVCRYSLCVLEAVPSGDDKQVSAMIEATLAASGEPMAGLHCSQKTVPPSQRATLELVFDKPLADAAAVYLVAQTLEAKADYAWCRWSDLRFGKPVAAEKPYIGAQPVLRMRSAKFPELAGRLQFILGQAKLNELARDLGFSPLLIAEETGAMQTHPLREYPSAAIMPGGVPAGALRVACDVETAHPSAPAFVYVMAVLSPALKDKERALRNILAGVDARDSSSWQGVNGRRTAQWQAKMLYANQPATLEMDLVSVPAEPADIIFAVKPVGDSVSYGWCRWYSYNVTTRIGEELAPRQEDNA